MMFRVMHHQVLRLRKAIRPGRSDREILLELLDEIADSADEAQARKALQLLERGLGRRSPMDT